MSAVDEEPPSVQRNLENAYSQIRKFGFDRNQNTIALDVDVSARHMTWDSCVLPCITRSRNRGHWITSQQRRTTLSEMMCFFRL